MACQSEVLRNELSQFAQGLLRHELRDNAVRLLHEMRQDIHRILEVQAGGGTSKHSDPEAGGGAPNEGSVAMSNTEIARASSQVEARSPSPPKRRPPELMLAASPMAAAETRTPLTAPIRREGGPGLCFVRGPHASGEKSSLFFRSYRASESISMLGGASPSSAWSTSKAPSTPGSGMLQRAYTARAFLSSEKDAVTAFQPTEAAEEEAKTPERWNLVPSMTFTSTVDAVRNRSMAIRHLMTTLKVSPDSPLGRTNSSLNRLVKPIVASEKFDCLVGLLVIVNCVIIGLEVDHIARHPGQPPPEVFRLCEVGFTVAFTLELALKLLAHGFRFFTARGAAWNVFDMCLVLTQLVDTFVVAFSSGSLALRILRLIRAVRSIRLLRMVGELRTMIACITLSLRSFASSCVLLMLMIFIVGVWFTDIVSSHRAAAAEGGAAPAELELYFGTLDTTFLSLFQAITGGIDWKDAAAPLTNSISPYLGLLFALYIAFAVLAVLNTVTGAFVQSALTSAREDKDSFMMSLLISDLFSKRNGILTAETFKEHVNSPQMTEYFKAIDVEPSDGATEGIFRLIDEDERGWVTAEEFLTGCMRLRGPAKALDLALLFHMVKRIADSMHTEPHHSRLDGAPPAQAGRSEVNTVASVPEAELRSPPEDAPTLELGPDLLFSVPIPGQNEVTEIPTGLGLRETGSPSCLHEGEPTEPTSVKPGRSSSSHVPTLGHDRSTEISTRCGLHIPTSQARPYRVEPMVPFSPRSGNSSTIGAK